MANVRCLRLIERGSFDDRGVTARFYAQVGGRWGYGGDEAALAVQLRMAALPDGVADSAVLHENDALAHLQAARVFLWSEREDAAPDEADLAALEAALRGASAVFRDLAQRLLLAAEPRKRGSP